MQLRRRMRPLLGTYVAIGVFPEPGADESINYAFSVIEKIQKLLSYHDPESELSKINLAGGEWTEVSAQTTRVVSLAREFAEQSNGLFNPTVGGGLENLGVLPAVTNSSAIHIGNANDIEIKGNYIRLRRNVRVVLDGIAKGWAVDLAVEELQHAGVQYGVVNAGGDLRGFGPLEFPVQVRDATLGEDKITLIKNQAIATSTFLAKPTARAPSALIARNRLSAPVGTWSVVAPTAWLADALTKVAALTPAGRRDAVIGAYGGNCIFASDRDSV